MKLVYMIHLLVLLKPWIVWFSSDMVDGDAGQQSRACENGKALKMARGILILEEAQVVRSQDDESRCYSGDQGRLLLM